MHPAAKVFQALRIFVNRELEGRDPWLAKIPSRLRPGSRVTFLTYHSLDASGSVLSTPPDVFATQMHILVEGGVRVVPLADLPRVASERPASHPVVALTFDDGFRNVYEHARPVLVALGLPATVFVVTDYCGRTSSWPGQLAGLVQRPLLGWPEIREMARAGIAFGSHSRSHADLRRLDAGEIETEMIGSMGAIEDSLGQPVRRPGSAGLLFLRRWPMLLGKHKAIHTANQLNFILHIGPNFALGNTAAPQSNSLWRRVLSIQQWRSPFAITPSV